MENKKSQAIYYLHAFFISGLKWLTMLFWSNYYGLRKLSIRMGHYSCGITLMLQKKLTKTKFDEKASKTGNKVNYKKIAMHYLINII
jgi:hypothetical protein